MTDYNYRAFSPSMNCDCGHNHHSVETAKACAEHLGWTDAVAMKVRHREFKRYKIPDYIDVAYDNSETYESTIKVMFAIEDQNQIPAISEKIQNAARNVKGVVQTELVNIRKVVE